MSDPVEIVANIIERNLGSQMAEQQGHLIDVSATARAVIEALHPTSNGKMVVQHCVEPRAGGKSEWWEIRTPDGRYLATCCDPDDAALLARISTPPASDTLAELREALEAIASLGGNEPEYPIACAVDIANAALAKTETR